MKFLQIRHLLPFLLACPLLMHCSCDVFGTAGSLLVSEDDETKLGAEFNAHLRDSAKVEFPLYVAKTAQDTVFQNYVTGIAKEIVAAIPADEKPSYGFTFTIIDKNVENAFAVPGGYVYIYTGIIKKMQDESELTGVLGHEIAHVTQHHYRAQMAKQAGLSTLIQVLVGNQPGQLTQLVAGSFFQLAGLKMSRENEADADSHGTDYEGLVKRNPLGIAKYFSRVDPTSTWFSTHPSPDTRVADITAEVNSSATLKALAADSTTNNYTTKFLQNTAAIRK